MKVSVLQPGARHNYLQSRFLFRAGCLQRLYSDWALAEGWPASFLSRLAPTAGLRGKFARRTVKEIPDERIRLWPPALRQNREGAPAAWPLDERDLEETDVWFTQYYAGGHGLRPRIRPDARIVSDVFIVPSTESIVDRECASFPEWGEEPLGEAAIAEYESFTRDMLADCDALFCPAQAVIDDVATYGEAYAAKCLTVPYGSSLSFPHKSAVEPKRILFAGTITLRKGPQYVKQAAEMLHKAGHDFTFVFAGTVSDAAARQLEGPNVELLGHVSKGRMISEYASADVFVLPSLAEGSAGVVLEAMSAGVPVVVTRNAGVDFEDGDAGIYVPTGDGEAIAAALEAICGDRAKRDRMSAAARQRSGAYDHEAWESTFLAAMRQVHSAKPVPA